MGKEDLPQGIWSEHRRNLKRIIVERKDVWQEQIESAEINGPLVEMFSTMAPVMNRMVERELYKKKSGWKHLEDDLKDIHNPFAAKMKQLARSVIDNKWKDPTYKIVEELGELSLLYYKQTGTTIIFSVPSEVRKRNGIEMYLLQKNDESEANDSLTPAALDSWSRKGFRFKPGVFCMTGDLIAGAGWGSLRRSQGQLLTPKLIYLDTKKVRREEFDSDQLIKLYMLHELGHTVRDKRKKKNEELLADCLSLAYMCRLSEVDELKPIYVKQQNESRGNDDLSKQYALSAEFVLWVWESTDGDPDEMYKLFMNKAKEIVKKK